MATHPLQPLLPAEIHQMINLLRTGGHVQVDTRIITVSLLEPDKQFVFSWKPGQPFSRQARATLLDPRLNRCYSADVDIRTASISLAELPGVQPLLTGDELEECAELVTKSEMVSAKILERYGDSGHPAARLENLICDPWSAGYFGEEGPEVRLVRPILFFKDPESVNPYAYPIEGFCPVVDLNSMKIIRIEDYGQWPLPPVHESNYTGGSIKKMRSDVKPLEISQPLGPSFSVSGNVVNWQKWSLIAGFNAREGLTLHDVRYEGRPILFRASISEMVVPYGDPTLQHARKCAFDVSDYGIGTSANSLKLGCDCLGEIRYLDAHFVNSKGVPWTIKNAICVHEEDHGVLWKHYDRKSGSTEVRRSRRLVVSFFATAENYDYGFYWYFYQDGSIQHEVKLTGILSLGVSLESRPKYGNLVKPQLYGPNHQHYFSYRLDFAVDGIKNSVFEVDAVSDEKGEHNPMKNAFFAEAKRFETEAQAQSDVNPATSRTWRISNTGNINGLGMPVSYNLIPGTNVSALGLHDSFWRKRARFVNHHIWVTQFNQNELCAAGPFPNQNKNDEGLPVWIKQNRNLVNEDIVLWYTLGVTHFPRPEDYPVMPVETAGFFLKPFGFFDRNPAWDVPPQRCING